jgi:hypothetical protein
LIGCTCLAPPVEAADTTAERSRIDSQRVAANAALAEQERACQARFLVAPCVEAARKQQRAVLTRLRSEELALDEAQRSENAARRRQTLLDKAAARDARADIAEPGAAQRAANHSASTPSAPASARADMASEPRTRSGAVDRARRAALEEESMAKFEARARSAQAHREAVEQRNAQRAAAGKRAAPLPVPAAASAAAKAGSAP